MYINLYLIWVAAEKLIYIYIPQTNACFLVYQFFTVFIPQQTMMYKIYKYSLDVMLDFVDINARVVRLLLVVTVPTLEGKSTLGDRNWH